MLMQLGTLAFEVYPFNTHEYSREAATDYARKPVVGAREILEYVGEGEETYSISGRLITKRLGGLSELAELHALRKSGVPQFLMRGDGKALGWFVIENVSETSTHIAADGIGQVIDFEIQICNASKPSPARFAFSLFGASF